MILNKQIIAKSSGIITSSLSTINSITNFWCGMKEKMTKFINLLTTDFKMMKTTTLIALFCFQNAVLSQDEDWLTYPAQSNDTTALSTDTLSSTVPLNYELPDGTVEVQKDERIDKIAAFVRSGEESLDGVLIDGFRVLIYFDQDKQKSEQQKAHFLALYNDTRAYVDYTAPNYRVRVGNFRTRLEAEKLKHELLSIFPTAIVVEDKIQLPVIEEPTIHNLEED